MKSRDDRKDDRASAPKPLASSAARRVEAIIEGAEKAAERVIDEAEGRAREYLAEAEAAADRTVAERLAALGELTDALVAQADAIRRQSELLTRSLREAKARLEAEGAAATSEAGPEASGTAEGGGLESVADTAGNEPVADTAGGEPTADVVESRRDGGAAVEDGATRPPHLTAVEPAAPPQRFEPASAPQPQSPSPPEPREASDGPQPPAAAAQSVPDQIAERRGRGTPAGARLLATQMAVSGSSREEIAARLRTGFEIDDTEAILDAILGPEA